ncbi:MAG: IS1380 family transposase, partial [Actinobacteria bacterium]|nr:IS1380 family transposase [Actinomycetota bacterium]
MGVTLRVTGVNAVRRPGRITVGAEDPSLTPYAGLAVSGELARRLGLAELIDAELAVERRARPVKVRRRGLSPGGLIVSLAECQLVGGSFFDHIEDVRADRAGAGLRAVAGTPSAPAALQNAKRFRRCHVQRVERAMARAGGRLDRALGRDASELVTIDLDATQVTVYGAQKDGAARSRHGHMSYAPHIAFWAQRGRALTSELVAGNREKLSAGECATIATRAIRLLPADHGPVTMRIDSAYYAVELLERLRAERARFTVSVPRNQAMWKALAEIPDDAWADALDMPGAQVAETTYTPAGWRHEPLRLIVRRVPFSAQKIADGSLSARRRKTIHPDQLAMALDGQVASVFGYSFIATDLYCQPTVWIEHFHRHRAQIEERLKDAKLGQALRHLPSGNVNANRVWLTAALLALNLT